MVKMGRPPQSLQNCRRDPRLVTPLCSERAAPNVVNLATFRKQQMAKLRFVLVLGILCLATIPVWSPALRAQAPLTVVAASDLQSALPVVAAQFEKDTGHKVNLSFGSSGALFAQIQNGAPFDVFLSADIDYPKRLEAAGLADRGSLYEYAYGHLVLWTRMDSGVDVRPGLGVLKTAAVKRIAIANPQTAPYGRAAVAALRHEGLYEQVQSKLVIGENISQTAQFVESGNAQVGLIALSLASSPALKAAGTYADIPASSYPPIQQAAVVVASSTQKPAAQQFIEYLKRPSTIALLQSFGFAVPTGSAR
jgi:molybdate transport system substrate-binding protein